MIALPVADRRRAAFQSFTARGGKFRVAVINACNLNCFFCHNEAMDNPRVPGAGPVARSGQRKLPARLGDAELLGIMNAFARLGGPQINVTGGEPLARPGLVELLEQVHKGTTRVVLNSNALLADRLLDRPRSGAIDGILASLHTTDDAVFTERLGGASAQEVMQNIAALARHGYDVEVNYSLGPYNEHEFPAVLAFCQENALPLKAIALVRPHEAPGFYGGDWVDPRWLEAFLEGRGATAKGRKATFGGETTTYELAGLRVKVKNIARGRLFTSFCAGCPHASRCGEGIYGLRVGVDGLWKPCLLRQERFSALETARPYDEQILDQIAAMVGEPDQERFRGGAPE